MFHVEHPKRFVDKFEKHSEYRIKDFLVSGEEFSLIPNEKFGFLETYPRPGSEDLPSYYESKSYISHTDTKNGLLPFLYQTVKKYSLKKKARLIKKLNSGVGDLLDIGAGTGDFLMSASVRGWNVSGVEPSEAARKVAMDKGLLLRPSIDELEGQYFDVITLWHVLEHIPDLEESLQKIQSLLKPNGVLIVAVPNLNSWDANYYKSYWAAFDVPRHLWHFSKTSLMKLITPKLRLVKIKPMVFDSFYVSLLSEKHKTGTSFSLKAFWIGLRSNWSARSTGEYSSLIYCFKKPK